MNIIINGASGYIGYYLTKELLGNGHTVYAVCRKSKGLLELIADSEKLHIIMTSQEELYENLKSVKADVWYQLLWEGACGELRSSAEIQLNNEMMMITAMITAHKISCPKIVYAGTVYENIAPAILENSVFDKNSFYIISKKHSHEMTLQLSKKLGINYVWCQFCQPVGRYMKENQLIPYAVKAFVTGVKTQFGNCDQYFDIISVRDLAYAFRLLGEKAYTKNFYFIGSEKPRLLKEYIEEVAEICNVSGDIGIGARSDDGMKFDKAWFDNSDFVSEFMWAEKIGYEHEIKELAEYYRENLE